MISEFHPVPKGKTRLQDRVAFKREREQKDRDFRAIVWTWDKSCCRKCGCHVTKTMERLWTRGEVHHVHGRTGALRYEPKCALLLCLRCHELLTGKVNERWEVIGTAFFWLGDRYCIDARSSVSFRRIV